MDATGNHATRPHQSCLFIGNPRHNFAKECRRAQFPSVAADKK